MQFTQKIVRITRSKLYTLKTNFIVSTANQPLNNDRGEGFLDVAMKVLVVIVIGVAVMAALNAAVPGLFTSLISRITSELAAN